VGICVNDSTAGLYAGYFKAGAGVCGMNERNVVVAAMVEREGTYASVDCWSHWNSDDGYFDRYLRYHCVCDNCGCGRSSLAHDSFMLRINLSRRIGDFDS
jgi:hypothetical protein